MIRKSLILLLALSMFFLFSCAQHQQENSANNPKYHSLILSANLKSNQENEDNILDGELVIIDLLIPEDKQIVSFKYNGIDIKDQIDGLKYAFEIRENVVLVLELEDKPIEIEDLYYQLELPSEVISNQDDNLHILAGSFVMLTINIPDGKELISFKINGIEKNNEVIDRAISFYMDENKQITVEFVEIIIKEDYYAVYINIDGFAQYYYDEAVRQGKIPNLKKYVELGTSFTNLETVYPSITGPVQAMIVSAATSEKTNNVYKYYDVNQNKVVLQGRVNNAETFYEKAVAANLPVASVRHFIADTILSPTNLNALYVNAPAETEIHNATVRFDQAIKIVKGEEFDNGGRIQQLNSVPRLLTIYVDDIDGIGHNGPGGTYGIPRANNELGRIQNVVNALSVIDAKIEELVLAYKARGLYEKTVFVITTDHGMTPYGSESDSSFSYSISKFNSLKTKIESLNPSYKVECLGDGESPKSDTTVVAFVSSLNVGITFLGQKPTQEELIAIKNELVKEDYIFQVLTRNELILSGVWRGAGIDLVITPSERYHFSNNLNFYSVRGNHDSYQETSRHIFGVVFGGPIKKQVITTVERNVSLGLVVADALNITLYHSDKTKRLDVFIDNEGE